MMTGEGYPISQNIEKIKFEENTNWTHEEKVIIAGSVDKEDIVLKIKQTKDLIKKYGSKELAIETTQNEISQITDEINENIRKENIEKQNKEQKDFEKIQEVKKRQQLFKEYSGKPLKVIKLKFSDPKKFEDLLLATATQTSLKDFFKIKDNSDPFEAYIKMRENLVIGIDKSIDSLNWRTSQNDPRILRRKELLSIMTGKLYTETLVKIKEDFLSQK